jgi:hypothetical protein
VGNSISFRDLTGNDLEFLDSILVRDGELKTAEVTSDEVLSILSLLCVDEKANFGGLVPRSIGILYREVINTLFTNYMTKEIWLRQCYSIQNGSFQNVSDMEKVPMSKFTAMSLIHKQAMDSMSPQESAIPSNGEPV